MHLSPQPLSDLALTRAFLRQQPAANAYLLGWMSAHGAWGQTFEFKSTTGPDGLSAVLLEIEGGTYCLSHGPAAAGRAVGRYIADQSCPLDTLVGPTRIVDGCRSELEEPANAIVVPQLTYRLVDERHLRAASELRAATEHDLPALVDAGLAMHAEEAGKPIPAERHPNYRASVSVKIKHGRVWVVRDPYNDALVFKAAIPPASPHVALLEGVWVAPRYRRRGLGRRYVAALCDALCAHHHEVALHVNADNVGARSLYEQLGFRAQGDFTYAVYTR